MTRRGAYTVFLLANLLVLFTIAVRSVTSSGHQPKLNHAPVLGFVLLAVAVLVWLQPRAVPYALGVSCLSLAFIAFWLASPIGLQWTGQFTYSLPYGGRVFGYLFISLFPLGWVLISASIGRWWSGIVSYFITGFIFVLFCRGAGLLDWSDSVMPWLFWPHFTAAMLGMFGWTLD